MMTYGYSISDRVLPGQNKITFWREHYGNFMPFVIRWRKAFLEWGMKNMFKSLTIEDVDKILEETKTPMDFRTWHVFFYR